MSTDFTQTTLTTNAISSPPIGLGSRGGEMKSPTAFRTISEVATDLSVPQHVLRFWESKFQQIKPLKRGGGRRYYRPEDIQLIGNIKDLLYNQGFTIRGVQKLLKENGRFPSARSMVPDPQVPASMLAGTGGMPSATQVASTVVPNAAPATPSLSTSAQHQNILRGLSPEKRREVESILNELKALRALLSQSGV